MAVWLKRVQDIHHFCVSQLVYPLALSSLLATGLCLARVYISHRQAYQFMTWNLLLAWVPYLCSLAITIVYERRPQFRWLLILPGFIWLIFLPNAPYIVTDLLHLDERPPVPLWYDIGLLTVFAWTGCLLGVVSLSQMQSIVRRRLGAIASWCFALGAIGLSGLGIYLGRFLQWNSWDIFVQPKSVIMDIAVRFIHPLQYRQTFGVTLLFAALLLVCYVTFVSIENRKAEIENVD